MCSSTRSTENLCPQFRESMKNYVYLDAEYTDASSPQLLSLGLVSWDGREHYVELDPSLPESTATFDQASDFVRTGGVLDQWGRVPEAATSKTEIGQRTADWLLHLAEWAREPLVIAYDHLPDFVLLQRCVHGAGRWDRVGPVVRRRSINEVDGIFECNLAAEYAYEALRRRDLHRHHALADAHALRAAHVAYTTGKRVRL